MDQTFVFRLQKINSMFDETVLTQDTFINFFLALKCLHGLHNSGWQIGKKKTQKKTNSTLYDL